MESPATRNPASDATGWGWQHTHARRARGLGAWARERWRRVFRTLPSAMTSAPCPGGALAISTERYRVFDFRVYHTMTPCTLLVRCGEPDSGIRLHVARVAQLGLLRILRIASAPVTPRRRRSEDGSGTANVAVNPTSSSPGVLNPFSNLPELDVVPAAN